MNGFKWIFSLIISILIYIKAFQIPVNDIDNPYKTLNEWKNQLNIKIFDVPNTGHCLIHALTISLYQDKNYQVSSDLYINRFYDIRRSILKYYLTNEKDEYSRTDFVDIPKSKNSYRKYLHDFSETDIHKTIPMKFWGNTDMIRMCAGIFKKNIVVLYVIGNKVDRFEGFTYMTTDNGNVYGEYDFPPEPLNFESTIEKFKKEKPILLVYRNSVHYNAVIWNDHTNANVYPHKNKYSRNNLCQKSCNKNIKFVYSKKRRIGYFMNKIRRHDKPKLISNAAIWNDKINPTDANRNGDNQMIMNQNNLNIYTKDHLTENINIGNIINKIMKHKDPKRLKNDFYKYINKYTFKKSYNKFQLNRPKRYHNSGRYHINT